MTLETFSEKRSAPTVSPPLRVLFVSRWLVSAGGGGVQTYMSNAARALAAEPIQLRFAALLPGSVPEFARGSARFGERGLPKWRNALGLGRWLRKALPDLDLVVFHGVMDWHFVVGAMQCRRAGFPYIARTAGALLRVPFSQSKLARLRSEMFVRFVVAPLLRAAACVIASTERERDAILTIDSRIHVRIVPAGTDVPREPTSAVLRTPPSLPLRLLFVGRLEPIKGLPLLFRAVRILDGDRFPIRLEVIGSGDPPYEAQLKADVERLGIAARVEFHGDLRGDAKLAVLTASHVLILPSYSENFGFVVVEAMAQGIPVVVSDGVGLAEAVSRAGAGQVFPKGEADGLAGALAAYRDSEFLRQQALRAHACAQKEFSIEAMGKVLADLFREVARRSTTTSAELSLGEVSVERP